MSRYSHAIVCRVPDSFASLSADGRIDVGVARQQHRALVNNIRQCGIDVIEMEADEDLPDCTFIEDTCLAIGSTALLLRPGHPSRRKNVAAVKHLLQHEFPKLRLMEVTDQHARVEGGDILYTGLEIFVGLSNKTNEAGALAVASAFPDLPVTPIKIGNMFHLKNAVSVAGPQILAVGNSKEAQDIHRRIEKESTYRYQVITVPDDEAANCLYLNNCLLHVKEFEGSSQVLETVAPFRRLPVPFSEFIRANSRLTNTCILLTKSAVTGF